MSQANCTIDVDMLVELQAIYRLNARRDHAVDQKDWATYAELDTDDYVDFQDRDNATGVSAMEDNLFWMRSGEKPWLRGFGFYHYSGENLFVGVG